ELGQDRRGAAPLVGADQPPGAGEHAEPAGERDDGDPDRGDRVEGRAEGRLHAGVGAEGDRAEALRGLKGGGGLHGDGTLRHNPKPYSCGGAPRPRPTGSERRANGTGTIDTLTHVRAMLIAHPKATSTSRRARGSLPRALTGALDPAPPGPGQSWTAHAPP